MRALLLPDDSGEDLLASHDAWNLWDFVCHRIESAFDGSSFLRTGCVVLDGFVTRYSGAKNLVSHGPPRGSDTLDEWAH